VAVDGYYVKTHIQGASIVAIEPHPTLLFHWWLLTSFNKIYTIDEETRGEIINKLQYEE
jgi:hypothetical protein